MLADGEPTARSQVEKLWREVALGGLHDQIAEQWPKDPKLPRTPLGTATLHVFAARECEEPALRQQAYVYKHHDVVGVSLLEDRHGQETEWPVPKLDPLMSEKAPGEAVGVVTVSAALVDGAASLDLIERLAPWPTVDGWEPMPGLFVAEAADTAGRDARVRRLVAIASRADAARFDRWLWRGEPGALPAFTRYLTQATKLRHHYRLIDGGLDAIETAIDNIETSCAQVRDALREMAGEQIDRALAARRTLEDLRADRVDAGWYLADIQATAQSARIALANVRRLEGHAVAPPDEEIGKWLLDQIEADETYLVAARTKADELDRSTGETVAAVLTRRRENLVIVQASVLGGLTMGLATAQALDYHGGIPVRLDGPLVLLAAALALALPSAAVRWLRGGAYDPRWAYIDVAFAAAVGAAAGRLFSSIAGGAPLIAWCCATAGALIAAAAAEWRRRGLRSIEAADDRNAAANSTRR